MRPAEVAGSSMPRMRSHAVNVTAITTSARAAARTLSRVAGDAIDGASERESCVRSSRERVRFRWRYARSTCEQFSLSHEICQLASRTHAKLRKDVGQMRTHGAWRDVQGTTDLLVGLAGCDQAHDL